MQKSKTLAVKPSISPDGDIAAIEAPTSASRGAVHAAIATAKSPSLSAYRKNALAHYRKELAAPHFNVCVVYGFGVQSVLEVAHLDQNRKNCALENLAVLCPNCHKMHDIGLIPTKVVLQLRDQDVTENWLLRIKDAGPKAAITKKEKSLRLKKSTAAKKAWETRTRTKP